MELIQLAKGVYAIDTCTYIPEEKLLVVADIHLGFEEYLRKQGVLVPKFHLKDCIEKLDWILKRVVIKKVVLNGDVKHEFGTISQQEWKDTRKLIHFFEEKKIKIVVVKGNHDIIFHPLAEKHALEEVKELRISNFLIIHGDKIPENLAPIVIMGHEHPAITLRERGKAEKFKCFLVYTYKNSSIIVQPSFNPLTQGTDITKELLFNQFLQGRNCQVYFVNDKTHEVLPFGTLAHLKNLSYPDIISFRG